MKTLRGMLALVACSDVGARHSGLIERCDRNTVCAAVLAASGAVMGSCSRAELPGITAEKWDRTEESTSMRSSSRLSNATAIRRDEHLWRRDVRGMRRCVAESSDSFSYTMTLVIFSKSLSLRVPLRLTASTDPAHRSTDTSCSSRSVKGGWGSSSPRSKKLQSSEPWR